METWIKSSRYKKQLGVLVDSEFYVQKKLCRVAHRYVVCVCI